MKKLLLWLWQLPQNIIGFIWTRGYEFKGNVSSDINFTVYYTHNVFGRGVTLGNYIILDYKYCGRKSRTVHCHEYGHHIQSMYLGWLYLVVIGIPSVIGNIIDRIKDIDYYKLPWEAWADKLGGVIR